jgi:hypothetical protein
MPRFAHSIVIACAFLASGCSRADDSHVHYALKVVVTPDGGGPSSPSCIGLANSAPSKSASPIGDTLWLRTSWTNEAAGTVYDVRLFHVDASAKPNVIVLAAPDVPDGAVLIGSLRYEPSAFESGATLSSRIEDKATASTYDVKVNGSADPQGGCP